MTAPAMRDLLFEIGVEELPASFVESALSALPALAKTKLAHLRLRHGDVRALGTPRRIALLVAGVAAAQADLEEEVTGPPAKAAFKDGAPTKAAEAFAAKLGVPVGELRLTETPKGQYVTGTRREKGRAAADLLPDALAKLVAEIPFRKSMRWGAGDALFGRPIQWLVALFGEDVLPVHVAGLAAGRETRGHRFLGRGADDRSAHVPLASAGKYVDALRAAHVIVDPEERRALMRARLAEAAAAVSGQLIEDEFLHGENLSLVEEPHVVAGSFEPVFLELPERVILEVAKGHQRYFGVRGADGRLLPRYLAVVNTAENVPVIRRGNDNVMRARLADARFFYKEDLRVALAERRDKLEGIVFQKRLGTMFAKAKRIERLARELGLLLMLPEATIMAAASGAHLAKCDLTALMVGEFPELQGEMGRAYALAQGVSPEVAEVIQTHYMPKGAQDATAPADAGALVAMADRLDTLVGCFAIGLTPTGAADPYALRRACIGVLRTAMDRGFDLSLRDVFRAAYDGYEVPLDVTKDDLSLRLGEFFAERLRGLLTDKLPADAVNACLAVAANRPLDARARATAIVALDAETRARVGEVFKRATNIAASAPAGDPSAPHPDAHATEKALFDRFVSMRDSVLRLTREAAYGPAFAEVAAFAPLLHQYFIDVYVMAPEEEIRNSRLRLMRAVAETCSELARFDLLGETAA